MNKYCYFHLFIELREEFIGGLGENRTLDLCHVKATS